VLLFALAVIAVVIAVDLVLGALYVWGYGEFYAPAGRTPSFLAMLKAVPAGVYLGGAAASAAVILLVSLFSVARLAEGGVAVARMVGARRLPPDTADPLERRLRNVVEEMAIASGVRVPEVYVMDGERGINAFAAGWDVSGAVVAVTRGTLETLTRDELQGVVAHEFSHILNGDMRLNVRMIGVLAGIVFIGSIGEFVMRSMRGSRDSKGFFVAGLAIFVIGYVGLFFARLIKSAVSRQREFLADASSVQFTRNPDGIAGALDQIKSSSAGTLIANRYAEEMSHMFFGQAVKVWFGGLFDTHPPLEERIRRAHPRFQASDYRAKREVAVVPAREVVDAKATGRRAGDVATAWGRTPAESAALVGTLDSGNIDYATRLLGALPDALRTSIQSSDTAGAVMTALLLAEPEDAMKRQLEALGKTPLAERALAMAPLTRRLGLGFHLPVIDLALAALKPAPPQAKQELIAALEAVVNADRRVSLHEFVVLTLVRAQLVPNARPAQTRKISDLKAEAATVLALVAHAGTRADAKGSREAALQAAIKAGAASMGIAEGISVALTLDSANAALEALRSLAPMQKGVLVKGLFAAVTVDGTIRVAEAGLMRLVGAVLDCPLPPLLDSLDPATLAP
ncbi:MAG TPA: M48 family metallopeptidase, partial [Burkholderiales bacterium]|nr:M48 family metallopeptidase [Burkholderiales bacterium]